MTERVSASITVIIFIFFFMCTSCSSQNSGVEDIMGSWEEIKDTYGVLDFDNLDNNGNPTEKMVAPKRMVLTFHNDSWQEGNSEPLPTKYKVLRNGVIAIYYDGKKYAYAEIVRDGFLNFCLAANPQAIMSFKRKE